MSKSKYKTNNTNICIKLAIDTDDYLRKFILDNALEKSKVV